MTRVLALLAELDRRGAVVDLNIIVVGAEPMWDIVIDAPRGALDAELLAQLRAERALIVAAVQGRRSGHVFAACSACGEVSMVRASWQRLTQVMNQPKTDWPACRMTPACSGRHVPSEVELNAVTQRKQPTLARHPGRVGKARLLGTRMPWPHPERTNE